MVTINNVDFGVVVGEALEAARAVASDNWDQLEGVVSELADAMANDVAFVAEKMATGEFNEDDAAAYMEDQITLARVRLRSAGIVSLQIAERIWNAVADVFRGAINTAIGVPIL